jgi:protein-disulfide isomerase
MIHKLRTIRKCVVPTVLGTFLITSNVLATDLDQQAFDKAMEKYLSSETNIEKMSTAIQNFFNKKRMEEQKNAEQAESKKMEEQFKNPVKVDVGDSPFKGPKDAKITVVEFSDFQCPFCTKGKAIVDELVKMYPKDVKVVFKNLPLVDLHPQAKPAAKAALAAGKQNKFWEMHDFLFDNQKSLSDAFYPEAAKAIGLDVTKFNTDFASAEIEKSVEADLAQAKSLNVQGTPNFFINGVNLRGAYPIEEFKKIIDRWLSMKQ